MKWSKIFMISGGGNLSIPLVTVTAPVKKKEINPDYIVVGYDRESTTCDYFYKGSLNPDTHNRIMQLDVNGSMKLMTGKEIASISNKKVAMIVETSNWL